jgi:hypothetical protein
MNIYNLLKGKNHNLHYLNRYTKFIEFCKVQNETLSDKQCYLENHHILPKAKDMFPEYSSLKEYPWNGILLTARQHFIAHWILWKCFGGSQTFAFRKFIGKQPKHKISYQKITPKVFESLRNDKSKLLRSKMQGSGNHFFGKTHSMETREKISLALNSKSSAWRRENSSRAGKGNLGKKKKETTIPNYKSAALARPKFHCPHCDKVGQWNAMIGYHGDKCKFKPSTDEQSIQE